MQVCVCVLGFSLTEQDTWWPRSLLTALISLEISKLGTCAEEGRYAAQLSGLVLRLSSKSPHFYWVLSPSTASVLLRDRIRLL